MLQKKPSQPDDELTARLRAAARKRRPWTPAGVLVTLAVILVPVGLCVWWFWPEPELPPLEIVAFDQLGVPGGEVTLRARLEPIEPPEGSLNLGGQIVNFEEELLPLKQAGERQRSETHSNRDGEAETIWPIPADRPVRAYLARQLGDRRRPGKSDRAQIFAWPADSSLLAVDVQETLAAADEDAWRRKNVLDITPVAGAGKALSEAVKNKYRIVYLAPEPDRALIYRKVRGWVANQQSALAAFPAGPVLGRTSFAQEPAQAQEALLRDLREHFSGRMLAVVARAESAAVCRTLGLDTILIGNVEAPAEVTRVKSWAEAGVRMMEEKKRSGRAKE